METPLLRPKAGSIISAILLLSQSIVSAQSTCPNSDFSQGNFANWQGYTGTYNTPSQFFGLVPGRHTIMNAPAIDPFTCGGLNVIPPGGTTSAQLGNSNTGAEAERLLYTVSVTPQTALFIYKYAVVLENPTGHLPTEQPEFSVRILDANGNPVGGSCGAYSVYGGQPGQNFQECGAVTWLPWSTVGIDLTTFMGQNILVEFTTKDCILTGHFGYAYISAECSPMTLDLAYCAGDAQITLAAPPGFQQYVWNPGGLIGQQVTIPTPALGTVFTCTMTTFSNQGNCEVELDVQIAPTAVTADFTTTDGCENVAIQFSDSSVVNNGTITDWLWTFGDGSSSTAQFPDHIFANPGSYFVQLVAGSSAGCTDTIAFELDVFGSPNVAFTSSGICSNDTVFFTNQSSDVFPLEYSWDTGDGSQLLQTENVAHLYAGAGNYNVSLTATNTMGCTATATQPVQVFAAPVVDAGPNATICPGNTVTFAGTGALTYLWDNGITDAVAFTPSAPELYTVIGTDANGCSDTDQVELLFFPDPVIDAGADQTVCNGESVILSGAGATAYSWNPAVQNNVAFVPPTGTTVYTVTGTDNNGCSNTDDLTIVVYPLPVVSAGNDQMICAQSSVTLSGNGAVTYVWDNNVQNGIPFQPLVNAPYTVVGTDLNGCTDTATVTISIEPPIVIDFTLDVSSGCAPHTVEFTNMSIGGVDCLWEFSDGSYGAGCGTIEHEFQNPGCYDISLTTISALGCVWDTIIPEMVCVFPNPVAGFQPDPSLMSELDPTTNMINSSIGAVAYEWDFGDGSTSQQENPSHTYSSEITQYTIVLSATSDHGCKDTAEAIVEVQEELIFYVPNTFTPDGDQYNEVFKPQFTSGFDRETYHLYIYNRWGQLVFESRDVDYGWNGSFAGEIAQDGTYTWKIEFRSLRGYIREPITGHVNILK